MDKVSVSSACFTMIREKVAGLEKAMEDVRDSIQAETKSSAGDKHETSRAMAQIELDQIARQLEQAKRMEIDLEKIDPEKVTKNVTQGSLVQTDKGYFFLSIALGQLKTVGGETFFAISTDSPLGRVFLGKGEGEIITFNERTYKILAVS